MVHWYSNLTKINTMFHKGYQSSSHNSTRVAQNLREKFTKHWEIVKNSSPKLEFYSQIKTTFGREEYLTSVREASHRASLTRFRISAHNLFIERGRYMRPLIAHESRWCAYCYQQSGYKTVESETHALLFCPLYRTARKKLLPLELASPLELLSQLSDSNKNKKINPGTIASLVHSILEINKHYTKYYDSQECHNNTGNCTIL